MLPEKIELEVVTPQRHVLDEQVESVEMPGKDGYLGILPGHAPLMTELGIGELTYRGTLGNANGVLAVIRGFVEVLGDRVTVLAETAERAAEIDLARAEAAKARAEKRMASGDPNIDMDRAFVALQSALIRIQIARKYRGAPVETR